MDLKKKTQSICKESELKTGELIYLGTPDDTVFFGGTFRVLDQEKTNTGERGIFLLCENLIS